MAPEDLDPAMMPTEPGTPAPNGPVLPELAQGRLLGGRYEIRGYLGAGGMGSVYRVYDREIDEEVALKILLSERTAEPMMVGRFRREARLARRIAHPNVCRVFDLGQAEGFLFLTMEIVEGKTLRAMMRDLADPMPLDQALALLEQIALGLAAVHELGIVHRDLKPENIIVRADGRPILVDFGLASGPQIAAPAAPPISAPAPASPANGAAISAIAGTPGYMSPEQIRGDPLDARSDVFAFGVVASELLCAGIRPPVDGKAAVQHLLVSSSLTPAEIPSIRPQASHALVTFLERALAPKLEARFASAAEIVDALARLRRSWASAGRRRRAPPLRALWTTVGVAIFIVLATLVVKLRGRAAPITLVSPPLHAPPLTPTSIISLPLPPSPNADALEAYSAALSAHRSGARPATIKRHLHHAISLDRSFGAASLQLAAQDTILGAETAKDELRSAEELADGLTERDKLLLEALKPAADRPARFPEMNKGLNAALKRFPMDAQLYYLRAVGALIAETPERAQIFAKKALDIDPFYARAYALSAAAYGHLDRAEDVARELAECLRVSPSSEVCRSAVNSSLAYRRRCASIRSSASSSPDDENPSNIPLMAAITAWRQLVEARDAIEEAEEGSAEKLDIEAMKEPLRSVVATDLDIAGSTLEDAHLSILVGDFDSAGRALRELDALSPAARQSVAPEVARLSVGILSETGAGAEAGKLAEQLMESISARPPRARYTEGALMRDVEPILALAMRRAGRLSEADFIQWFERWSKVWSSSLEPARRSRLWLYAHAAIADDAATAASALRELPAYEPLLSRPSFVPAEEAAGRTFLLGKRFDDAITWLSRATEPCNVLEAPIEHTRAHLWLGQARELKGDRRGACAAYRVVLDRWGKAEPTSVTANVARRRAGALGCPP